MWCKTFFITHSQCLIAHAWSNLAVQLLQDHRGAPKMARHGTSPWAIMVLEKWWTVDFAIQPPVHFAEPGLQNDHSPDGNPHKLGMLLLQSACVHTNTISSLGFVLRGVSWTRSMHTRTVSQQVHPPMHACAPFLSSLRPSIKGPVKLNKLVAHFHFHVCEWTFVPGDHRAHIGDRASVRRTGFEPCRCLAHQWLRKRMFLVALKVLINVI